ncbi:uncharacterized protein DUF2589 [Kordia periserrulae]|uniref:Uncharacterized protein DUF2589 n=1 Tax=Kordia periserrulae TaxID=701523 RepID=A0A2T6BTQ9_9FLAO|nr:DUF2589 domain-containing protein [Kordia periserrulae]PTX59462.1 uncharacterized protein DUF2589 [Kordia periserrulae]
MADSKAIVSMAQQFTGLPIDNLIGAPLMAAATANNAMALTQTRFLLDTCFEAKNDSDQLIPIMIKMELVRGVIGQKTDNNDNSVTPIIEEVKTTFNLPLLTIVPLNSLAVDDVYVKFHMEVKSSYSEDTSKETRDQMKASGSFEAKMGWGPLSATVRGNVSKESSSVSKEDTHYSKENSAEYDISVHAKQIPLPDGVKTIINAFTLAIEPIQLGKDVKQDN